MTTHCYINRQSRLLQVWATLRVPEVIHITCNMNACDLPGTYVCPCYNYYMYSTHTFVKVH